MDRLQELEERVAYLEHMVKQLLEQGTDDHEGIVLTAPVTVVGTEGRTLLTVQRAEHDVSVRVFNAHGEIAASLGVDGTECGYLAIRDADDVLVGYLDVEAAGARLTLEDHARKGGITLFGGDNGDGDGGGLNISNAHGEISAAFWAGRDKSSLSFYDGRGDVIAVLP